MDNAATGLIVLGIMAGVYFGPSLVAAGRNHRQSIPIFVINLGLGWTIVGWFGCLAWAFMEEK